MAETSPLAVGDSIGGRFLVQRVAGSGGMGTVFRAIDRETSLPVAIKVIKRHGDEEVARFARETHLLAELRHPRIVRFLASGAMASGEPYLVTEWLEGEDLARWLERGAPSIADVLTIGRGVAEALGAAHRRGVVHRDIKPSNIFLVGGKPSGVKVLDFGIARADAADLHLRTLTQTGSVLGTPGYMPPEQARGDRAVDARADVFSLGSVLYRCLSGHAPFGGQDALAAMLRLAVETPPRLIDLLSDRISPALDHLVMRMLSKSPSDRPSDGDSVALELAHLERAGPASTRGGAIALGREERRVTCVVIARPSGDDDEPTHVIGDETDVGDSLAVTQTTPGFGVEAISASLEALGAELVALADGTFVVTIANEGAFVDRSARLARAALAIRRELPSFAIVVATVRAGASALGLGDVIDRGVALLRHADAGGAIRIDEDMAGLLAASFDVRASNDRFFLHGERASPAARTFLGRSTPCVGRDREIATLLGVFDEVIGEPVARVARILGGAGAGKSRVRAELVARLRERAASCSIEVWSGRGDALQVGSPFGLLASVLRDATGIAPGDPISLRRLKLKARVERRFQGDEAARINEFLSVLLDADPSVEGASPRFAAARRDPVLMSDQLRRAFEDFVAAEARDAAIVIVLEAVEHGDLASLEYIDAILRSLADRPLFVVAVARPELERRFPKLWADRAVVDVPLGELTRKSSERLVRDALGDERATVEVVERIVRRGGGNALFLEELVRAVAQGKGEALPETVLGMMQARLDDLPAETRRVLRAASVFGEVCWREGIIALLGGEEAAGDVAAVLGELNDLEILLPRPASRFPGQGEYVFRQALLREAAYSMLTPKDRALGHRLAARWLEEAGEPDAGVLGEHYERGGEPERALAAHRRAAHLALEGNDLEAAIAWATRGGEHLHASLGEPGRRDAAALARIEAEARFLRGDLEGSVAAATRAMSLVPEGSAAWFAAVPHFANACSVLRRRERVVEIGEKVLGMRRVDSKPEQVPACARLAELLVGDGCVALGAALLDEVRACVDDDRTAPSVAARIRKVVAMRAMLDGDPGAYLRSIEGARVLHSTVGDQRALAATHINLGSAYASVGAHDLASRSLDEAIAIGARIGLPHIVAIGQMNLGMVLGRLSRFDDALALERTARQALVAQGNVRFVGGVRCYTGRILHLAGRLDAAEREIDEAIADDPVAMMKPFALALKSMLLLARGQADDAIARSRDATELVVQLGGLEEGEAFVALAHAMALDAKGDDRGARAAIGASFDQLLARAEKLDRGLVRGFFQGIDEHARTVELAIRWSLRDPPAIL